jgi:hypothetical protein
MELQTIDPQMGQERARELFEEYRESVRARHSEEDVEIMRGYRALSKGQQLIVLAETVKAGGTMTVEMHRSPLTSKPVLTVPRLAVCHADAEMVWCEGVNSQGDIEILSKHPRRIGPHNRRDRMRFTGFETPERTGWWNHVRAIVPNVPPRFRPKVSLRNYHLLFEAEWAEDPTAPVDPALLRHIGGDLYAVLATWDLTDLERAVLARRA